MNTSRMVDLARHVSRRTGLRGLVASLSTLGLAKIAQAGKKKTRKAKRQTFCLDGETVATRSRKQTKKLKQQGAAKGACLAAPPRCSRDFCTVFVTGENFSGAQVGGLAGGDAKCQAEAASAGFGGVYRAWLSTSAATPATRFTGTSSAGPYRLVANTTDNGGPGPLVAANFAALTSCFAAGNCLTHGIDRDATGDEQPGSDGAWTGTRANGAADPDTCSDWSTDTGSGRLGTFGRTDARWTEEFQVPCATQVSLYCFEQAI